MKLFKGFFVFTTFGCGAISLHAQPAAVQQLQNSQQQLLMPQPSLRVGTNAPELYAGENEDIGPQRILRINGAKTEVSKPDYFDVLIDSQVFYTDNANFAQNAAAIGSWVFVNTAQAAFAPPPMQAGPGRFAPAVGFSSQWYNYANGQMSALDFNAQTLFVNGKYLLGKWQVSLGANYTRLLSQDNDYDQTYREFLPTFSVQRAFPIGQKMLLVIGDAVDYHFTKVPLIPGSLTDINDHLDDTVFVTFNWQLAKHLIVQPFYRFQYSYYIHDTLLNSDRSDYLNTFGVTLLCPINKYASVRAFCNYNTKQSDDNFTPSYQELDGGLGAALDVRF